MGPCSQGPPPPLTQQQQAPLVPSQTAPLPPDPTAAGTPQNLPLSEELQVRLVELTLLHARKGTRITGGLTGFYNDVHLDLKT